MYSGMVSKIQKAKFYSEEPERFHFEAFKVTVQGDNSTHTVSFEDGAWTCTCEFFDVHGVCSHTMAMENLLDSMIES